ncbi:F-box/kelch-repeat protein At3g06240-like [Coffea arabica]|uniref:F-box/kelch-repeat protein At3g06240-like n=1 Tax=Coffea arabica TaxID=13443 RepID=A0A6P6SE59_COFAR|nr:F-box/kelch-repeat protein At3g06240-like [Coffea arabica]
MDVLPEDILMEILVRLPVKCLFQFKCVSKSWCSLIKSPRFTHLHVTRAKNGDQEGVILVKRFIRDERKIVLSFHSMDESLSLQVVAPDFEVPYSTYVNMILVGTCHGIICLKSNESGGIYLCNPATREFLALPDRPFRCPQGYFCLVGEMGFGFDAISDDFKIITFTGISPKEYNYDLNSCKVEIYSLSTNSWRELDPDVKLPEGVYYPRFSVLFNGCFHWCTPLITDSFGLQILSFELSTEQFREIQFPDGAPDTEGEYGMQKLIVLDNSLAMIWYNITGSQISDQHFDIWVMMEYGVQESWVKKFSIGPLSGIQGPLSSWNSNKLLWEMSNGQLASCAVLGDNRGSLTKYNIHGSPTTLQADIYHESLVALGELCGRRMN